MTRGDRTETFTVTRKQDPHPQGEKLSFYSYILCFVELRVQEKQCGFGPGRGTVDKIFTLAGLLRGSWESEHPVYMCFVDLEKAYDRVPRGIVWGLLREYGVPELLLRAIRSLYNKSRSCVRILGTKLN